MNSVLIVHQVASAENGRRTLLECLPNMPLWNDCYRIEIYDRAIYFT